MEVIRQALCCIKKSWRYVISGFAMSKLMIFFNIDVSVSVLLGCVALVMIELFSNKTTCLSKTAQVVHHSVNILAGIVGICLALIFHAITGLHLQ